MPVARGALTAAEVAAKAGEVRERGFCVLPDQARMWSALGGEGWLGRTRRTFLSVLQQFADATPPNRGANRYYMNVPPAGPFLTPLEHPDINAICAAVLGEDFAVENLGSDTPFRGSEYQRLHRDQAELGWHSLVVNIALSEQTLASGPFEILPGTQEADVREVARRVKAGGDRPQQLVFGCGDVLIRDPRIVHRGSPSVAAEPRPSLGYIMVRASHVNTWALRTRAVEEGAVSALSVRAQRMLAHIPRRAGPLPFAGHNSGEETLDEAVARMRRRPRSARDCEAKL